MNKRDFKDKVYSELAKITKSMANPHRLEIIELLAQGEFSVEQIYLEKKLDMLRLTEDHFVNYTTSRIPRTPPNYETIASLNKQGSYEGHNPADLEAGANRCAIA